MGEPGDRLAQVFGGLGPGEQVGAALVGALIDGRWTDAEWLEAHQRGRRTHSDSIATAAFPARGARLAVLWATAVALASALMASRAAKPAS